MKKILIASLVGGIILFICQFLSWALFNLHESTQQYTEKQDAIMSFLNSQQLEEGGYYLPNVPKNAGQDEREAMMKTSEGKPWATIQYHKTMNMSMTINVARALIIDILTVFLFCWLVRRFGKLSFSTILTASLIVGMIVFLNAPYTNYIWYQTFDVWIHLVDALVGWGLVGIWLGWWMTRGRDEVRSVSSEPAYR